MTGQQEQEKKRVLAFDTSTISMAIVLLHQEQLVAQIELKTVHNHSLKLVPAIQSMMQGQGWKGQDIDLLAVGMGPGSYTGVRVAVTAAKTMAWAWDKPVVGVSSLHALALSGLEMAHQYNDSGCDITIGRHWVYPLMDARRGQVYTARFMTGNDRLGQRVQADGIRLFSQVAQEVSEALEQKSSQVGSKEQPECVWFVGEIEPHLAQIHHLQQQLGTRIQALSSMMRGHWIGRLGRASALHGQVGETHRLKPNYTQLTEAEVKMLARGK